MGSSSKKKKQKKADFQKVKLKVGKKIPKGNVVDTTFKAKKIVIKEQLQNAVGKQDGRVKRDIKEYLSKLKHHSMTLRGEAMKNLKESLTAFPELIQANVHSLVECLSEVFTDPFTPLRKLNIAVLKLVFSNIQPSQVIPFFPIIVAHLRCGMTHIIHEVQADSLNVIDLLIDSFPQHLKYFSKHLLQDFLNQISNQTKAFSASVSSQHKNSDKRVLASDPSRKVTSLSWYLQVLHRLQNVLKTILGNAEDSAHPDKDFMRTVSWDPEKPLFLPFCSSKYITANNSTNSDNPNDFFEDKAQLCTVLSSLMPLLFQIWIEAKNLTSGESLEVYQCIAEIIHMLWKIVGKWQTAEKDLTLENWFVKQFSKLFLSNCMTAFPYSGHFKSEQKVNSEETNLSQNAMRLNLLLCDILTCVTSVSRNSESKHLNIVRRYMVNMLNVCKKPLGPGNTEIIVDIIKKLFVVDNYESNQNLLESAVSAFQKFPIGSRCYVHFLKLLMDIVEQPGYAHLFKYSSLSSWFAQIPVDLVKAVIIPWKLIDIMRLVAPRRQTDFLSNLQLHLPNVFERLNNICISDGDCSQACRVIIDMLYWIPQIETSLLSILSRLCITQTLNLPLICHVFQVLNSRYQKGDEVAWSDGPLAYISFLLSISFGSSKVELLELQSGQSEHHTLFLSTFPSDSDREFGIFMDSIDCLEHQKKLMKMGLMSLHAICEDVHLCQLLEGFLVRILEGHTILPLRCVLSLLSLSCHLCQGTDIPKNVCFPSLEFSMLFLELLVNEEEIHMLSLPVIDAIMSQPNLSSLICHRLLKLASGDLSDRTITILGGMTLIIVKACKQQHTELLEKILQCLKNANEKMVSVSLWFVAALYELSCMNGGRSKK